MVSPNEESGKPGTIHQTLKADTNASVGSTQVVEWVNESFAVFDKATGALVYGPAAGNTLWTGLGWRRLRDEQ
jgi:hypothetical protein